MLLAVVILPVSIAMLLAIVNDLHYYETKGDKLAMNTVIIDVREPSEYTSGHVRGALNIPPAVMMQGLPKELADTPKDTKIILYCRSGARSAMSAQFLSRYGFTNLVNGINKGQVEARHLS
jgi:rhodanese-related sulfurtransferase